MDKDIKNSNMEQFDPDAIEPYDVLALLKKSVEKMRYSAVLCEVERSDLYNLKIINLYNDR